MKPALQALLLADDEGMRMDTLEGLKTISIREGDRDYRLGPMMIVDHIYPFVVQVDVISVRKCKLSEVTEEEWSADGFTSVEDMLTGMRHYYPDMALDSTVTIIRWNNVRGYWVDNSTQYFMDYYAGN